MGKRRDRLAVGAALILLLGFEILGRVVRTDAVWFPMVQTILTRVIGALVFLPLIRRMGYPVTGGVKKPLSRSAVFVIAAAWIVALNNLPIVGLLSGNARVTAGAPLLLLFLLECAAVHAVYNFCGTVLARFGEGIRWDALTIALTAGIGLAAAVPILAYLLRADHDLDKILPSKQPPEGS